MESVAYWNQILLIQLYLHSTQKVLRNWIVWLLLSLLCWPKVILLIGEHCTKIDCVLPFTYENWHFITLRSESNFFLPQSKWWLEDKNTFRRELPRDWRVGKSIQVRRRKKTLSKGEKQAHTHTPTHTHAHTHDLMYTLSLTHTNKHTNIHSLSHMFTLIHTLTKTQPVDTHTHTLYLSC